MEEIKIRLTDEDYDLVKKIYSVAKTDSVQFNDENKDFVAKSIEAEVAFELFIYNYGLDENDYPTEYGKKLYELHDLIFYSEEI